MASQNNLSNAASMVAVKKEYDANTDDEVELSVADEIIASEVASSMVAVKKEYDADTDDEVELFVADKIISSEVASSMVAVKKECEADTDSDEEQQQQPNKKAKRDDNEHEKHIAEIRKITDQLLSPGRQHDATVLKQIRQIARDLESFSNELKKSANDVEEELVNALTPEQRKERKRSIRRALTPEQRKKRQHSIQLHMTLLLHASTCRSQECQNANCAKMKGLLKHGTTCKVKANGGCELCKRIWALLQIHAKQCKQENCPVPNCMAIRERYRQLRLQQQQDDHVGK